MKLTEKTITDIFGDKTFLKGLDYYNSNRVFGPVKIEDTLFAQVLGRSSAPYEVRAFIKDTEINTHCTCPVGYMCKHGAALLLKWVNEPSSFVDADRFLLSLEKISKDEIINMIKRIIKENPSLINEFSSEAGEKPVINIDAISDKIGWIVHGELDYSHVWDAVHNLEEIKDTADKLKEKASYKNAAEIYLALVKGGVTAFDEGIDDSDGSMGDFVSECVTGFNESMKQIDDLSYKNKILESILDIVEEEDYGLETQEMLYGVITEENVHHVEEYMLEKLEKKRKSASDSSYTYKKGNTIEMLIELYGELGKPEEKLRLAQYELTDKDDYTRFAKVLMEEKRFEDAFDAVKKGLALPGKSFIRLNKLYFELAVTLIQQKPDLVDFQTSLDVAFDMMSWQFNKEEYDTMKRVFYGTGKLEQFKSAIQKNLKNRNSAVQALLYDGELKPAIDIIIRSEPGISSPVIIDAAKAAKDKGMLDESGLLTRMVLEQGRVFDSHQMRELLEVMINTSDMDTLQDLCDRILKKGDSGTAILLMPYLLKKAPALAAVLAKSFVNKMPVELVEKVARAVAEKEPEKGVSLCRQRITQDILHSHVYYDKAVLLLRTIRDIYTVNGKEAKWLEFIRGFAAENKGKKKLMDKLRKELGVKSI